MSGPNLNSPPLTYTSQTGTVATDVTFHNAATPFVQLFTPNAGTTIGTDDRPEMSVSGSFGTLSTLTANFNLLSASPSVPPDGAYFDIFAQDPGNPATKIEIITYSATALGIDTLNSSTQVHTPGNFFAFGDTLSTVDGLTDGTTTLGNWAVYQVGVQIGGYSDYSGAMTDDISSFSIGPSDPNVPDAGSTALLLGFGCSALAGLRRYARSRRD